MEERVVPEIGPEIGPALGESMQIKLLSSTLVVNQGINFAPKNVSSSFIFKPRMM
jgi:hypothetical protein